MNPPCSFLLLPMAHTNAASAGVVVSSMSCPYKHKPEHMTSGTERERERERERTKEREGACVGVRERVRVGVRTRLEAEAVSDRQTRWEDLTYWLTENEKERERERRQKRKTKRYDTRRKREKEGKKEGRTWVFGEEFLPSLSHFVVGH